MPESKSRRPAKSRSNQSRAKRPGNPAAATSATATAKPKPTGPSPLWVPTLVFTLLITGVVVIITNYMGILPGGENNKFLLVGIGQVTAGFIAATALR